MYNFQPVALAVCTDIHSNYLLMNFLVFQVCLKKVTITRTNSENQPLKGSVKVVRVDERYSSDSTTDSSCLSSELEVNHFFNKRL